MASSDRRVTMEELFERIDDETLKDPRWTPVECSVPELSLKLLELSAEESLLRCEYDVDLPVDMMTSLFRPEIFFHRSRMEFDEELDDGGVEQLLAPGDAICWARPHLRVPAHILLHWTILARSCAEEGEFEQSLAGTHRCRLSVRRDFGRPGRVAVASAPFLPNTDCLVNDWGACRAISGFGAPHPDDPSKTRITEVKRLSRMPTWALPMYGRAFVMPHEWARKFATSPTFREVVEGDCALEIVSVRKCTKGPPLLPVEGFTTAMVAELPFSNWSTSGAPKEFNLAMYLNEFQARLDDLEPGVAFHDTVDGQRLVPYQAAVRRGDWKKIWGLIEKAFRRQRTAYRHLLGGKCAPELNAGLPPRFLGTARAPSLDASSECRSGSESPKSSEAASPREIRDTTSAHLALPVHRTFVHFNVNAQTQRQHRTVSTLDLPDSVMVC